MNTPNKDAFIAASKPVYEMFVEEAGKEWAEKIFRVVDGGYAK